MEHLEYYGLPADPFQNDADARFYYESAPQKRARLRLLRGIHQKKALSVLVGGPGLGKTTLAHVVLRALEAKDYAAHYLSIPHEACSSSWLLPNVARGFGVPVPAPTVQQQIDQIQSQLVAITTAGRTPVLLIDEAQLFRNREAMEEFRGILNLSHEGRKLLSLVLFGLPELAELLKLDPPLAQRVEVRVEMIAMDWLESQAYVSHRLRLAGATSPVFAPDALEALFRFSGGVPRLLNTLADNALFEGFLTETKPVSHAVIETAASGLGLHRIPSDSVVTFPPVAPPAPDLLAITEIKLPEPEKPARAERPKETMPIARPSPVPAPDFDLDLASSDESASGSEGESGEVSAPDWLEPVSPMPADTHPGEFAATLSGVDDEPELDAAPAELDLEEVVAEETLPPTPAAVLSEPEPELEPDDADEEMLGPDSDDSGVVSLGSLVRDDSEEEDALASLGAPEPAIARPAAEIEDLAPVRRTQPMAKPAPRVTPARAVPAAPTPAKPVAVAKAAVAKVTPPAAKPAVPKPTPAKPAPSVAAKEEEFDLSSLVDESEASSPALAPPAKDGDDDDLDALFDEIQIGDK
jgi:general secretion pathway protein A